MSERGDGIVGERDPRYQRADAAIRDAFLRLFEKKGLEEITASEVIGSAGVNRSTFYAHYDDKYALMEAVERDFVGQMEDILKDSPTMGLLSGRESDPAAWERYFNGLLDFLEENKRLFAGLASRKDSSFMADFSKAAAQVIQESGATSRLGVPLNYESALIAWGMAGLVDEWARGGFVDDRERIVGLLVRVATSIQETVLG